MRIDLTDKHGHSCCAVYDNTELYISLGRENAYGHNRPVAIVDLYKLKISVTGHESVYDLCKQFLEKQIDEDGFKNGVIKPIDPTYALLDRIIQNSFEEGYAAGQEALRKQLNNLLGRE